MRLLAMPPLVRRPLSGVLAAALLVGLTGPGHSQGEQNNTIVIRKGGTYRGSWTSLDPNVPAVTIQTRAPVVIERSTIRGRGALIRGYWVNLTVRDSRGTALPAAPGTTPGRFIAAEDVLNLRVENNLIEGTSGIYVSVFKGARQGRQTVKVLRNRILNVDGRYAGTDGKPTGRRYPVQAVQLNSVQGVPGIEIAWNEVINEPGKSFVEENINLYRSSGTAQSPIAIHNNYIRGAYAFDPARDPEYSGGGIMVGDGGGDHLETSGRYVNVYHNQVVSTSNQGIAISGGNNQRVYANRVVSSGLLPSGQRIPSANVGIYVWDQTGGARRTPRTFFNNTVEDNLIGFQRIDAAGRTIDSPVWLPDCTPALQSRCAGNRTWPGPVTLDTERAEYVRWQDKLRTSGQRVGPR